MYATTKAQDDDPINVWRLAAMARQAALQDPFILPIPAWGFGINEN